MCNIFGKHFRGTTSNSKMSPANANANAGRDPRWEETFEGDDLEAAEAKSGTENKPADHDDDDDAAKVGVESPGDGIGQLIPTNQASIFLGLATPCASPPPQPSIFPHYSFGSTTL
jgi:hypothetical protein